MDGVTIPSWLQDISLPGAIVLFGFALATNWLYTRGQVNKMMETAMLVAKLWETVAKERQETNTKLLESTEPLIQGNAAILKAIEELQRQNERNRHDRGRRG